MYEPDIATMAIGQGIAVTPLQMLRAICAIANGGELLKPYIIDKIVMPDGRVLRQGKKEVVRRVISEDVASQMRTMMEKVVSEGGGKPAHIAGYQIAGKTGTAENWPSRAVTRRANTLLPSSVLYRQPIRSMRCW